MSKKAALVVWIREYRDYHHQDELRLNTLEDTFLKLAAVKPHKKKQRRMFGEAVGKF